jgi:L-threonylcarbamoyladenylate synthase
VYGLGANALDEAAVQRIYSAKGRPAKNPLIAHIAAVEDLSRVAVVPPETAIADRLQRLAPLWPGPLTVVLPRNPVVPAIVSAGLSSIAVRIPSHPIAREIIKLAGVPVAAPSANPSRYVSPTTAHHVVEGLGDTIDYIIDGGGCSVGIESTIVSLVHPQPTVLRHGSITLEDLRAILGEVDEIGVTTDGAEALPSPGLLRQHYSPRTPLVFEGECDPAAYPRRAALITFAPRAAASQTDFAAIRSLSPQGDLTEAARTLFATLRELDNGDYDIIVVEPCTRIGLGRALMDRLSRAASQSDSGR